MVKFSGVLFSVHHNCTHENRFYCDLQQFRDAIIGYAVFKRERWKIHVSPVKTA